MSADRPEPRCVNCLHTWQEHDECPCPHEKCDELVCSNPRCVCTDWVEYDPDLDDEPTENGVKKW